jgi:hypothetical protein
MAPVSCDSTVSMGRKINVENMMMMAVSLLARIMGRSEF